MPYETFDAADGEFVMAVGNDELWRAFCRAIGLADLADDPGYATNRDRVARYDELRPKIAERLLARSRSEWLAALTGAGIPCGSVRNVGEVLEDPQLSARQMIETVDHVTLGALRVLGVPIKLSDTPGRVRTRASNARTAHRSDSAYCGGPGR